MNNSSYSEYPFSFLPNVVAWCTAFGITNIAILLNNILVLYVFHVNRKMLKMRANYFILNLCCADMIIGCVSLPLYLHRPVNWIKYQQEQWTTSTYVYTSLDIFSGFASTSTLVVIALERVYAICLPLRHKVCTAKFYFMLLAAIWLFAAFMTLLYFFDGLKIVSFDMFFYTTAICLLLSFLTTTSSYIAIWCRAISRRHCGKMVRQNLKLAQTLKIITIVFGLTWLPFQIINVVYWICAKTNQTNECVPDLAIVYLCKLLQYVNSFANPIVYSFKIPEFKKTLASLLKRDKQQRTDNLELCQMASENATRLSRLSRRRGKFSFRGSEIKSPDFNRERLTVQSPMQSP